MARVTYTTVPTQQGATAVNATLAITQKVAIRTVLVC